MANLHDLDRSSHFFRFFPVHRFRSSGFNPAKAAGAGTDVSKDHKGGCSAAPTIADVRASCFFAHRVKVGGAEFAPQIHIVLAARGGDLEPFWKPSFCSHEVRNHLVSSGTVVDSKETAVGRSEICTVSIVVEKATDWANAKGVVVTPDQT